MEKIFWKTLLLGGILIFCPNSTNSWGFFAHKNINRLAIFTLPAELGCFYKKHIEFITESAVLPDKRRYIIKEEAPRHYLDLDFYQDSFGLSLPINWDSINKVLPQDSLHRHGVLPWHLMLMKVRLTEAFKAKDQKAILKLSADIGHYIGDAHVPLHTCSNYNGQLTNQRGIHGLWESRLPELYFKDYDFFVGKAEYLDHPYAAIWKIIFQSHAAVDSVLQFERNLTLKFPSSEKYSFEDRGGITTKVYANEFCKKYNQELLGQIERRMRSAVKFTGNFWYTCWVDAGQPDLREMQMESLVIEEKEELGNEDEHGCKH